MYAAADARDVWRKTRTCAREGGKAVSTKCIAIAVARENMYFCERGAQGSENSSEKRKRKKEKKQLASSTERESRMRCDASDCGDGCTDWHLGPESHAAALALFAWRHPMMIRRAASERKCVLATLYVSSSQFRVSRERGARCASVVSFVEEGGNGVTALWGIV